MNTYKPNKNIGKYENSFTTLYSLLRKSKPILHGVIFRVRQEGLSTKANCFPAFWPAARPCILLLTTTDHSTYIYIHIMM